MKPLYQVKTQTGVVYAHSGSGARYSILWRAYAGTTLSIFKEINGWGNTGFGWVYLKYTKRI